MSKKLNLENPEIVPILLFFQKQGLQCPAPNQFEIPKLPDQIHLPYPPTTVEQRREELFKQAQEDPNQDPEILKELENLDKQTILPQGPKPPKR